MTISEVPLTPDDRPVYEDKNITVFALPVLPTNDSEYISPRERSTPEKDASPDPGADTERSITARVQELIMRADFYPATLGIAPAQEWRRQVMRCMFPGTSTGSAAASTEATRQPVGLRRSLPQPERATVGSANPQLRPTLAYAIEGPRVRGKFDVRKAEALGLGRGPLRAVLARGQPVVVRVNDGQGGEIEREIKPEDCIGEGVLPGVSISHSRRAGWCFELRFVVCDSR